MARHSRTRAPSHANLADGALSRTSTSRLRQLGVVLVCAKVVLVPLVFDPSLDMPFVVSKAVVSHRLASVFAGVIAGLLVQFGRSFFLWSWLHIPVVAFLVVNVAATFFAVDPTLALYGTHARMLGLGSTFDFVVLYFAIVLLIRNRVEAVAVVASALVASAFVLSYEVVQLLRADPFRWSVDTAERPFSTLGQATTLAEYLTVLAVGACAIALLIERIPKSVRIVTLAYSGLLLVGAVATGTRSVLIGFGLGSAIIVLLIWILHPSRRTRAFALLGAISVAVVLAAVVMYSPLGARLAITADVPNAEDVDNEVTSQLAPSAAARLAFYEIGLDMLRERPILGYGPDNFIVGVPRYRPEPAPWYVRQSLASSAHSWPVQVATSSGLIGLGCFIAITVVALGLTLRRGFHPVSVAGIATLTAFLGAGITTVNELGTDWLFWLPLGAIAAATAPCAGPSPTIVTTRAKQRGRPRDSSRTRRLAAMLPPAIALVIALSGFAALDASRSARTSHDSRLTGRASTAIDFALRATRSDPVRAHYWHTLGLAYVASARWHDAIAAFERASTLAPYDVSYVGDLARTHIILIEAGDTASRSPAVELGERAVRMDPRNPRAHHTRAIVMQVTGNLPEAVRSVERALNLDPGSTNESLYLTATQVMLSSGRVSDAIRVARDGLVVLGHARRTLGIIVELARALWASGQAVEAQSELDIALSIQPSDPAAQRLRAEIRAGIAR